MNPWTLTAPSEAQTYIIRKADQVVVPDEGEGDEGGEEGGDSAGAETYIGSNGSRGMMIVVDKAAGTVVVTRAASGSLDNFTGGTTYTFSYATISAAAGTTISGFVNDINGASTAIMNIVVDADGVITALTWNGSVYTNYVKQ